MTRDRLASPPTAPRCSTLSREAEEPPGGTASTVHSFVLLECPGPWGVDAVRDSRLPQQVKDSLMTLARSGVRPLLVRRPAAGRRSDRPGAQLFAATAGSLWRRTLDDVRDLPATGLEDLSSGRAPAGFDRQQDPLFAVCTHGRHDACCAERGRPLAAAMAAAAPDLVWEVSHIGGDRFAPNVLVLPERLYYGRLGPADAPTLVSEHLAGRLDLEHLRGRTTYPFAVQTAEIHLRRHLGDRALPAYDVVRHERMRETDGSSGTTVVFDVGGAAWEVRVRTRPGPPRRLTCRAERDGAPPVHELVSVARVAS